MIDEILLLVSGGLTGTAIVTLVGLIIRHNPSLHSWGYVIAVISAIAFGGLLATKQVSIVQWVFIILFFGSLGVFFAFL